MKRHAAFGVSMYVRLAVMLGAVNGSAYASGFQLQEQSASGLGLAYSGMAAAIQDASTAFWNPAGMIYRPGSEVTVAADYVIPSINFSSAGGPPAGSTYNVFGDGGNGGVSTVVPAVYALTHITPDLAVGLSLNSPFGLSTDWDSQWAGMFYAVKSKVETLNINPAIAWRLNDVLSVGAGVSYQRLKATLTNALTPLIPTAQGRLDGSDWAWGWNLGLLGDFGQGTKVGLTYRAAVNYRLSGELWFNNAAFAPLDSGASTNLKLPQVASIAISQQIGAKLRLLADYTWTGWNSIQALNIVATSGPAAGMPVSSTPLNFKNSWRAGVGAEYEISQPWLLRAGVAYDRSPVQDEFRTPRLPDDDRTWLAVGASWRPDERWTVDFGYAYLWVKNASSNLVSAGPVPGALIGTYSSNINILGLQASMRF